jgi:trans-o-hydroxybenzylidenepyruvate hydratase-aldolase
MRALKDIGADGAFVGLPLWQTPTIENAVQFYADLGAAVPDMPIMVYANSRFFKSSFPTIFWERLAKRAPTVVVTKISYGIANLLEDRGSPGIALTSCLERAHLRAYKMAGRKITAVWSSGGAMGPEPIVALRMPSKRRCEAVEEIGKILTPCPRRAARRMGCRFPQYNIQVNRYQANAAGTSRPVRRERLTA